MGAQARLPGGSAMGDTARERAAWEEIVRVVESEGIQVSRDGGNLQVASVVAWLEQQAKHLRARASGECFSWSDPPKVVKEQWEVERCLMLGRLILTLQQASLEAERNEVHQVEARLLKLEKGIERMQQFLRQLHTCRTLLQLAARLLHLKRSIVTWNGLSPGELTAVAKRLESRLGQPNVLSRFFTLARGQHGPVLKASDIQGLFKLSEQLDDTTKARQMYSCIVLYVVLESIQRLDNKRKALDAFPGLPKDMARAVFDLWVVESASDRKKQVESKETHDAVRRLSELDLAQVFPEGSSAAFKSGCGGLGLDAFFVIDMLVRAESFVLASEYASRLPRSSLSPDSPIEVDVFTKQLLGSIDWAEDSDDALAKQWNHLMFSQRLLSHDFRDLIMKMLLERAWAECIDRSGALAMIFLQTPYEPREGVAVQNFLLEMSGAQRNSRGRAKAYDLLVAMAVFDNSILEARRRHQAEVDFLEKFEAGYGAGAEQLDARLRTRVQLIDAQARMFGMADTFSPGKANEYPREETKLFPNLLRWAPSQRRWHALEDQLDSDVTMAPSVEQQHTSNDSAMIMTTTTTTTSRQKQIAANTRLMAISQENSPFSSNRLDQLTTTSGKKKKGGTASSFFADSPAKLAASRAKPVRQPSTPVYTSIYGKRERRRRALPMPTTLAIKPAHLTASKPFTSSLAASSSSSSAAAAAPSSSPAATASLTPSTTKGAAETKPVEAPGKQEPSSSYKSLRIKPGNASEKKGFRSNTPLVLGKQTHR